MNLEVLHLLLDFIQGFLFSLFTIFYLRIKKQNLIPLYLLILTLVLSILIVFLDYTYIYEGFFSILYSLVLFVFAKPICKEENLEIIVYSIVLNILISAGNCFAIILIRAIFSIGMEAIIKNSLLNLLTGITSTFIIALLAFFIVKVKKKFESLLTKYSAYFLIVFVLFYLSITFLENLIFYQIYNEQSLLLCLLSFIIIFIVLFIIQIKFKEDSIKQLNLIMLNRQIQGLKERILEFEDKNNKVRIIKHDLKKTLYVLKNYINHDEIEKANKQISSLLETIEINAELVITGNSTLDCLLSSKSLECEDKNIIFRYRIDKECINLVDDFDLSLLLMNSLENAISNIAHNGQKIIDLEICQNLKTIFIKIKNTVDENVLDKNPSLISTKKNFENHGFGIASMRLIASKYDGEVYFSQNSNYFICIISLIIQ